VSGPFLLLLGGSATVVGLVSGLGELLGYGLRLASATWLTRQGGTGSFWPQAIGMLIAGPPAGIRRKLGDCRDALSRGADGKGIRPLQGCHSLPCVQQGGEGMGVCPPRGPGPGGAIVGPLVFTRYSLQGSRPGRVRAGSWWLGVPCSSLPHRPGRTMRHRTRCRWTVGGIGGRMRCRVTESRRCSFPMHSSLPSQWQGLWPSRWSHTTCGASLLPEAVIPLLYALAMGMDAVGALTDRPGLRPLRALRCWCDPGLNLPVAFLAFQATEFPAAALPAAALARPIWGVSLGQGDDPAGCCRGHGARLPAGHGLRHLNTVYGGAWFLGSVAFGLLYEPGYESLS